MRIVSLLPSITEIVSALGCRDLLVGRSHECNYPEDVTALPVCTAPKFEPDGISYQIDERVRALLQEGLSVYRVDAEQLRKLQPDLVLTQDHCEVCAASLSDVKEAVKTTLGPEVGVLSVSPADLKSVVQSIRTIASAIGAEEEAERLTASMKERLLEIQQKTSPLHAPDVLCLEWLEPLMTAGNWVPELVQLAGGHPLGARAGEHSPQLEWKEIRRLNPDIITIAPCGYCMEQTRAEWSSLSERPGWNQLKAVRNHQVFIMDGDHYFNRPGPRLVDSTRILAEIIHPSRFRKAGLPSGWMNVHDYQFQNRVK